MSFFSPQTLNYGRLSANPMTPTPSAGDCYYNTVLEMWMSYDATRSKWLSIEAQEFTFGRNGATAPTSYYRAGVGGRIMSANEGFYAFRSGTICSMAYTRSDSVATVFDFTSSGVSLVTVSSNASSGRNVALNADFAFGDILAVLNSGVIATNNVIGTFRVKWRA